MKRKKHVKQLMYSLEGKIDLFHRSKRGSTQSYATNELLGYAFLATDELYQCPLT
jgi:hypothetical protein